MRTTLVLTLGLLLLTTPAWAYVDPGTFGLVSQWGYIILVAMGSVFMLGFKRIASFVGRLFRRPKSAARDTDAG
jgi:hypothetical protein